MSFGSDGATQQITGAEQSLRFPVKVFFWSPTPAALIAGDYDWIAVEKRTGLSGTWTEVTDADTRIPLDPAVYNYTYVDPDGVAGDFYRAVLVSDGVAPDVPQPIIKAVDTAYEAIMTTQELRDLYLWGEDSGFINGSGLYQPEYTFVHNILYGIAKVERVLNIRLLPTRIDEKQDLDASQANGTGYTGILLDEYPVLSIISASINLPGIDPYDVDSTWLNLDEKLGELWITPTGPQSSRAMVTRPMRLIPNALRISYMAGFDPTKRSPYGSYGIPMDLKEAVGKEASAGPLNVGGDLIGGAGLAGSSISMDGLSQSITTTNSSTNAGFGARLIQYEKEMKVLYKTLRKFYKRLGIAVA